MPAIRPRGESNRLYRQNLAKGQTGLSIAFDLPTQTGFDSDHPLARGEVGKVGVAISHIGDMRALFDGIPLASMNTSMTINATAPWLMALYIAVADEQGAPRRELQGTTQNDIIKEYLARGAYVFPPDASLRLTKDLILFCARETPKWNPMNVCSYHLQEAGATPVQELSYALATAIAVLERVRQSGEVDEARFADVVGGMSFFVNAGMRFVTELAKMRAFVELWDEIARDRFGVADPLKRRFRYGVQVNSLGLTEQQPENNAYRILIEMLSVVLSRARAPAPCNCRPGMKRLVSRGRSTSNGRCASSRSWPMRPICSNSATCSRAARKSPPWSRRSKPRPRPRSERSTPWAARSRRSKPARSSPAWSNPTPAGSRRSNAASRSWSASTPSSIPSQAR